MGKDQGQLFSATRGRRRTGRLRTGLDATLRGLDGDAPPAALVALARVQADVLDGATRRHLHYTDADADPPFGLTTALPKLLERYAQTVDALLAGEEAAPDDLEAFLSALAGDPAEEEPAV